MEIRQWMDETPRYYPSYTDELSKFINVTKEHTCKKNLREIHCPCVDCKNEIVWTDVSRVMDHLVIRGFMDKYIIWTHHGEHQVEPNVIEDRPVVDDMKFDDGDSSGNNDKNNIDLEEMLRHVEPEVLIGSTRGLKNVEALQKAAKETLYDESNGCDREFSTLWSVLELIRLKARFGWSDSSFDSLLALLKIMLPKPNTLPSNTYQAKKLICPLSLGMEKIHACVNHCILYRK